LNNYSIKEKNTQFKIEEHEEWKFETNHNEFHYSKKRPLFQQNHRILFSELYNYTHLAWQEIIDMEKFWMDVVVRVKFA